MQRGSITIYLSLVLISVLLLVSIVIESTRINVVQTECRAFTHLASDSVLAGYARQVYKDYGILLVWEEKTLKEQLMEYIQANIEQADLNLTTTNIMATRIRDIKIRQVQYVEHNGGETFIEQILSYMKYSVTTESVNKMINLYSQNNSYQEKSDTTESMINVKENSEISKIVDDINNELCNIKNNNINNQFMTERKRTRFLKKVNQVIEMIESYQVRRENFLKEYKAVQGTDYMDFNLNILEQIKNRIEKEELMDSSRLDEKWAHISKEIQKTIKKLKVNVISEEDQKNKSIYESAKRFLERGILSMVIDDSSNISSAAISDSDLPSNKKTDKTDLSCSAIDKAKVILYGGMKFGNYCSIKNNTDLKYELEYIIAGEDTDHSNLATTVEQMAGIRNITTLAYILTDKDKMTKLSTIAASATTAIGLPFLEPVIKAVLIEAWALAEAVHDVKILMSGKKIDIIKNKDNWNTGLQNLLCKETKGSKKKSAINYQNFCYILLMKKRMTQIAFRMMDIIQVNIRKNYNQSFRINQCFSGFHIQAQYETEPLFVSMPFIINSLGEKIGAYNFYVESKMQY
ncbi:MAG: hypothetical protein HFG29_06280 [Eubacterium sp.]|nr:hypothetical protein [Eubacterium sp.]